MSVTALETVAGNRSRTVGGFRPQRGIPNSVPTPAPPPSQFPCIVSNIPLRLSKCSRPVSRGRDYDFEGGLGESPRSGSRLLQPPLPGGKGVRRLETRDRTLPFQSSYNKLLSRWKLPPQSSSL